MFLFFFFLVFLVLVLFFFALNKPYTLILCLLLGLLLAVSVALRGGVLDFIVYETLADHMLWRRPSHASGRQARWHISYQHAVTSGTNRT